MPAAGAKKWRFSRHFALKTRFFSGAPSARSNFLLNRNQRAGDTLETKCLTKCQSSKAFYIECAPKARPKKKRVFILKIIVFKGRSKQKMRAEGAPRKKEPKSQNSPRSADPDPLK